MYEHKTPYGLVYVEQPGGEDGMDGALPKPSLAILPGLLPLSKRLSGQHVEVVSAGWVRHPNGELAPIPDAYPNADMHYLYPPRRGGVSPARNEQDGGHRFERIIDAARFGQVNAYYHAARMADYVHSLLEELGASPLPRVRILTSAHSGYDPMAGAFHPESVLAGGHYRMRNDRYYDPPENHTVATSGEIHLGPGRYFLKWGISSLDSQGRTRRLDGKPYLHQPSHNPAIICHEYAHHVVRHTADFRCNDQRRSDRQSNAKSWLDEGTCDYFTAVIVGRSAFFAWQRAGLPTTHPRCRNLEPGRTFDEFDRRPNADPHYNGTIWATFLWQLRRTLIEEFGWLGRSVDKMVLEMLLQLGKIGRPNPYCCRHIRRSNVHLRNSPEVALSLLYHSIERHMSPGYSMRSSLLLKSFADFLHTFAVNAHVAIPHA